jgi:hypothetical protein
MLHPRRLPTRSTSSRRWITAIAIAAAFVTGVTVNQFAPREAQAQSVSTATVYVPPGGLVFRATDGTALARLSRDAHGGTFELFDDRHGMLMRLPKATVNVPGLAPNPYVTDPSHVDLDCSTTSSAAVSARALSLRSCSIARKCSRARQRVSDCGC